MAGSLTDFAEELALNMLFRNTGTSPTAIYLGLATNDPATAALGEASVLADVVEESDAGYARQAVTFNAPTQVSGKATIDNGAQLEFGPWAADASAPITYAFLTDAETGTTGNILGVFELPTAKQPLTGESILIAAGNCLFDLD